MRAVRRGAVALVLVLGSAPAGYEATQYVRKHWHDGDTISGAEIPAALGAITAKPAPSTGHDGPLPNAAALARTLATPVTDTSLGPRLRATVLDADTGTVLYQRGATAAAPPASTAKILTATALLAVRKPTDRLTTTVVQGSTPGTVVLVGGGDPTLTGASGRTAPDYPGAARIADLAAQVRKLNLPVNRVVVDDSLFTGPSVSPAWAKDDVPSDYASGITAVMADGGRAAPGDLVRSATPDLAAGAELAAALDIPDADITRGRAPKHARVLATVHSAPLGTLVEQMLLASDNVIAECLARQVALAEHQPASFTGAARAVRAVLKGLGVDPGAGLLDGSGLSAHDRLSTQTLTRVLRLSVTTDRLRGVLAALPVAAWSGTLAQRYRGPVGRAAAGLVRAKTGTLTAVSSLAGVVHDSDGRLLVFALIADRVPDDLTPYAEGALDVVVTRLSACGCR